MKLGQCLRCGCETLDQKTYTVRPELRRGRRAYGARGLCGTCYEYERCHGRLDQWPRRSWTRDELLDEWVHLRDAGVDLVDAAGRIEVSPAALDRALHRAMRSGDDRGRHECRRLWSLRKQSA